MGRDLKGAGGGAQRLDNATQIILPGKFFPDMTRAVTILTQLSSPHGILVEHSQRIQHQSPRVGLVTCATDSSNGAIVRPSLAHTASG